MEVKKAWSCPATPYAIMTCTEKNLCPFGVGTKYSLLWYEFVVLLGMQIGVKMELLINHVDVVVLPQINLQLMYSTVISVEKSSWTKLDLSHMLSNMPVLHWSRCLLIILWYSSYVFAKCVCGIIRFCGRMLVMVHIASNHTLSVILSTVYQRWS